MPSPFGADPAAVLAHTHRGYERLAIEQALRDADLARPSLVRRLVARLARHSADGADGFAADSTARAPLGATPATGRG